MRKSTKIAATLATLTGVAISMVGPATTAQAAASDLKIRNASSSSRSLVVCKDWGNTSCANASPRAVLRPGQTSPWADADGIYVPAGCDVLHPGGVYTRTGWTKTPGFFGMTKTYRVFCLG